MKKILIIQTAFIGDVILATPLVEKLHRFFPAAEIDFVLRKGNESLLSGHPKINRLLVWDKKKSKYNDLARISREIRKERYDLLLNLQRFASTGLLTSSSRAKIKIGFDKNPFAFSFTHKFPHKINPGIHEVDRNLQLIEAFTDSSFQRPALYPSDKDREVISEYQSGQYLTISPASVWFTKQYPAEKWVEFMDIIDTDLTVYLLGGPEDVSLCKSIKEKSRHIKTEVLAGKLSLLQSAALMKHAKMNYTNDSAPMHLASAVNAPVTAIFCSTVPEFGFGPLSDNSRVVQTKERLKCKPCGLHGKSRCPEGHFKCALTITPDQLL